jgi:hypothetical protein
VKMGAIDSGLEEYKPSSENYMSRAKGWSPHLRDTEKKETS